MVVFHWKSSSFQAFLIWVCSPELKFKFEEDPISGCWDIQLLIFWGRPPLGVVFITIIFYSVWSPELKFEIWRRSIPWLLRYSIINIFRSSSIGGRLPFKHFVFVFGPLVLSLKYEEDPRTGCWCIPPLVFWGRFPLDVVFMESGCKFWFDLIGGRLHLKHL